MRRSWPLVLLVPLLAACGSVTTSADCSVLVRYAGTTYVDLGPTARVGRFLGSAEQAACHDNGRDPVGGTFADATPVPVLSFRGLPVAEVIGLRQGARTLVMVAQATSPDRQTELSHLLLDVAR